MSNEELLDEIDRINLILEFLEDLEQGLASYRYNVPELDRITLMHYINDWINQLGRYFDELQNGLEDDE